MCPEGVRPDIRLSRVRDKFPKITTHSKPSGGARPREQGHAATEGASARPESGRISQFSSHPRLSRIGLVTDIASCRSTENFASQMCALDEKRVVKPAGLFMRVQLSYIFIRISARLLKAGSFAHPDAGCFRRRSKNEPPQATLQKSNIGSPSER